MIPYIALSSLSMVFALAFSKRDHREKRRRKGLFEVCLFLLMAALVFIQTFRSINVGGDLHDSYYALYNFVGRYDWNYVRAEASGYEIGYLIFNKIIYVISGGNITALLFAISIIYLTSLYFFIRKLSPNRFLSIFLFLSIGIYNTSMNNLRSTMALSLVLLSLCLYMNKKYLFSILLVVLGIFFHKTVVVFLLFYLLLLIKNNAVFTVLCVLLVILFTLGFQVFSVLILRFFPRYADYFNLASSGGGYFLMAFLAFLAVIIYMLAKKDFWANRSNTMLYKMLIFAIVLQFVSIRISFFSRAVFYFLYSIIILLPLVFEQFKNRDLKILAYIITIIGMTAFYIYILVGDSASTVPYEFIFQELDYE